MVRHAQSSVVISLASLLFTLLSPPTPATATSFDLIYVDAFDVTLCANGCGITLAGLDYALLVNTGDEDITLQDLEEAHYRMSSSVPGIRLTPFINIPNREIVGAVHPDEAMGSIYSGNEMLLDHLRSGESLRDLSGLQFMAFQVDRYETLYEGPVTFEGQLAIGDHRLHFEIHAEVHLGPHSILFLTATRATRRSAVLAVTPVEPTSWARLKRIYQ